MLIKQDAGKQLHSWTFKTVSEFGHHHLIAGQIDGHINSWINFSCKNPDFIEVYVVSLLVDTSIPEFFLILKLRLKRIGNWFQRNRNSTCTTSFGSKLISGCGLIDCYCACLVLWVEAYMIALYSSATQIIY